MRKRRFWFHYNKPESHRQGRNVLTMHYQGRCHLVHKVVVKSASLSTENRRTQPRCVVGGTGLVSFETVSGETIATVTEG